MFQANDDDFCAKVATGEAAPVRSNISRSDPSIGSRTGLDLESFEPYVRSGQGSSYSMSVASEEGQLFYLVVDYPERPIAGFNIELHFGTKPVEDPAPASILKRQQVVHVRVFDADTKSPIDAAVAIEGMVHDSIVSSEGMSDYTFTMDHYRKLRVNCARKGYMLHQQKIQGSNDPVVMVDLQLKRIAPGQNVILDDIHFVGNRSQVKETSETALQQLLSFMEDNPTVTIEVQGHVNGPKMKNKKEFIQLSTDRAKSVRNYLIVNDIDPSRVKYEGYGNGKMIYPEARTRNESEANRRVEIAVIAN